MRFTYIHTCELNLLLATVFLSRNRCMGFTHIHTSELNLLLATVFLSRNRCMGFIYLKIRSVTPVFLSRNCCMGFPVSFSLKLHHGILLVQFKTGDDELSCKIVYHPIKNLSFGMIFSIFKLQQNLTSRDLIQTQNNQPQRTSVVYLWGVPYLPDGIFGFFLEQDISCNLL